MSVKAKVAENGLSGRLDVQSVKSAKTKEEKPVRLLEIQVAHFRVKVRGTSPVIFHRFGAKAKQMIQDKQAQLAAQPKEAKDPVKCYEESLYLMPGSKVTDKKPRLGFPASGFKKACITSSKFTKKMFSAGFISGAFHIDAEPGANGLVEIVGDGLRMRTDTVRLPSSGVADLRYRGELPEWEATLTIRYDTSVISAEQIVNILNRAGFSVGIGEWRPEKKGSNGCFEVVAG